MHNVTSSKDSDLNISLPSEYMRVRRPEQFSDSQLLGKSSLTRSLLDHHLESLTSRSQEKDFEYFCRKLAEKELCPNLLPQTGPTGGGDSKVDSETYPVADDLSIRWYVGVGREAASERWAFAISAKKRWQPKIKADVASIAGTKRGYTVVYFMSNQFIRDKARASIEDELSAQYGFDVRVLDRSWILDRVFQNRREEIAIESLRLDVPKNQTVVKGALDTAREIHLKDIEAKISDSKQYRGVEYQLFEECLIAATLSRELELPRVETDGRFVRAENVARKYGTVQQLLRCAYAKAWTAFNWYDDFDAFNAIYDEVEEYAAGSLQAADLQLLSNLWLLLRSSISPQRIPESEAKLKPRTSKLKSELERLKSEQYRPGNSLQAESNKLLVELYESLYAHDDDGLENIFRELKRVLVLSKGVVSFPVVSLTDSLMLFGDLIQDSTSFEELFETIILISQERETEATAGRLLLKRGCQKLKSEKFYEAIRLFGRAQQHLTTHECIDALIVSLGMCSSAYEGVGLLWAARGNMIAAASLSLNQFWESGQVTYQALFCLQKLVWIEMRLGRFPNIIAWVEAATGVASALKLDKELEDSFLEDRNTQDLVLGILLLKTKTDSLQHLSFLPKILEELGFTYSRLATLFTIGQTSILREEGWFSVEDTDSSINEFFVKWVEQPASDDIPDELAFMTNSEVTISSRVLGCRIVAKTAGDIHAVLIAESIFSAIEAFLSTSLNSTVLPHRADFNLIVVPKELVSDFMNFELKKEDGISFMEVCYPLGGFDLSAIDHQDSFRQKIQELMITIVLEITLIRDSSEFCEKVIKDEMGLARALNFTGVATAMRNILGDCPKIWLSDWEPGAEEDKQPVSRSVSWYEGKEKVPDRKRDVSVLRSGVGELPQTLRGKEGSAHNEHKILSLIDMKLWDRADWRGLGFGIDQSSNLPVLSFLFGNREEGGNVSTHIQQKIGQEDIEEKLRISIVTGIDADNPAAYRIIIGMNIHSAWLRERSSSSNFLSICRIHTMEPRDSRNLDQFLRLFEERGAYVVSSAYVPADFSTPESFSAGTLKRELSVRSAWEIGENDIDLCGLRDDDRVIIPNNVIDPPVNLAIAQLRRIRQKH